MRAAAIWVSLVERTAMCRIGLAAAPGLFKNGKLLIIRPKTPLFPAS